MKSFYTIDYKDGKAFLIDQRLLPLEEIYNEYTTAEGMAEAITTMVVRGAPAIGVAAACGAALGARNIEASSGAEFLEKFEGVLALLAATRPTARNLFWALEQMRAKAETLLSRPVSEIKKALEKEARAILDEDIARCEALGRYGAELLDDTDTVLTHCNAGALATAGMGTALSPIYTAVWQGKQVAVVADETRPFLQGARLTAWELHKEGIPVTLICDNMAASMMWKGGVRKVFVGADRIAANGDTANKIGTLGVAILARQFGLPFYVVAPVNTIDASLPDGSSIPIEERSASEVTHHGGRQLTPDGVDTWNPAFDVTPAEFISAIVTDKGVLRPPFRESIAKALEKE